MRVVISLLAILALSAFVGCQSQPMVISENQPNQEEFKVRGDWVIEVSDPDGTLVDKRVFSNAIHEAGPSLLAALVTGDTSVANNKIRFDISNIGKCLEEHDYFWGVIMDAQVLRTRGGVLGIPDIMDGNPRADYQSNITWSAGCTVTFDDNSEEAVLSKVDTMLELGSAVQLGSDEDAPQVSREVLTTKELDPGVRVYRGQMVSATVFMSFE